MLNHSSDEVLKRYLVEKRSVRPRKPRMTPQYRTYQADHGFHWTGAECPSGVGTALLLARWATPEQSARVGDQTSGRVFLFLQTDDFWQD